MNHMTIHVFAKISAFFQSLTSQKSWSKTVLWGFVIAIISGIINVEYFAAFFLEHHYLPSPFLWDKSDSLMDFYSPLYWAIKGGFYETYHSVYPPLNYYLFNLFTFFIGSAAISDPFDLRNQSGILSSFITMLYAMVIVIVVNIGQWQRIHLFSNTNFHFLGRIIISLACLFSIPVIIALERGNIIFLAILFLALYAASENIWIKSCCLGVLINLKPYFGLLLIQYLNVYAFDKKSLLNTVIVAVLIFGISAFAVKLDLWQFLGTYLHFGAGAGFSVDSLLSLPNTLMNLYAIKWVLVYGGELTSSHSSYAFWFSIIKVLGYLLLFILVLMSIFKPLNLLERWVAAIILLTNFSASTGGYVLLCYLVLLPYLLSSDQYRKLSLFILIIFALPLDLFEMMHVYSVGKSGYWVWDLYLENVRFGVTLGSLVRPVANFAMMACFACQLCGKYGFFRLKI